MSGVRLILALHNHQPIGNFDGVFEAAYRDSYLPFLDVMDSYPDLPFALHTSGPLLEWLVEHQPDYIRRVRRLVESGRVEILGGGFFEPILTMIPHRDRVGQIRHFSDYLEQTLGARPRGIWLAERVWEQALVPALAEAGVEYTILDDFHFRRAGVPQSELFGHYLTEDDGRLLKVFPIAERLRYLIPFSEPHESYEYLRQVANDRPGSVVVFADDGEKFGVWPQTHDVVYRRGWLRRFCDMLTANRSWLQLTTPARAMDATVPTAKVYLPDSSYREMTEWALPAAALTDFEEASRRAKSMPESEHLTRFLQGGGSWRNFKVKYTETDEMYTRMLGLSRRLAEAEQRGNADPDYLEAARDALYRGQCNCSYWHGAFGGLYLPHLRHAIHRQLIAAHNALDELEGKSGPRVLAEVGDFNLDARLEVRLENDRLIAHVRPAQGGHIYALDDRESLVNVLAGLDRRAEAYHGSVALASVGDAGSLGIDRPVLKREGLDRLLVYDRFPRKALVDHFFAEEVTLDDLVAARDVEGGDFALGTYLSKVRRDPEQVALVMERPGRALGHLIHVRKTITLAANSSSLDVHYVLDELPEGVPIHFGIEFNVAGMAAGADDRYFSDESGRRLGRLDERLDLPRADAIRMTDEWLDLAVGLSWSQTAALWCAPIETVSQSESGFEGVYQCSSLIPRWRIVADATRRWEVQLRWSLQRARSAFEPGSFDPPTARTNPERIEV